MPLGLKRYQQQGHLHFITFSTYRREPTLPPHYFLFEHTLETVRTRYNLNIHGYVLMPEHVHLGELPPATITPSHQPRHPVSRRPTLV